MQLHSMVTLGTTTRLEIQNLFLTYQRYMFVYSYAWGIKKTFFHSYSTSLLLYLVAWKERHVPQPGASGFCERANEFCALSLPDGQAKIFRRIKITKVL